MEVNNQGGNSSRSVTSVPTAELYDRWAEVYDHDGNILQAVDDQELPSLLTQFFDLLSGSTAPLLTPLKITELGCGTGRNTVKLLYPPFASQISSLQALDLSPNMLEQARQLCTSTIASSTATPPPPRLDFHLFDALTATPPPAATSADGVISTLVLEHLPIAIFFQAVARLLKSDGNGYLLLTNMHQEMGERSQAGFLDVRTGTKVQGTSFAHGIREVMEEGERHGFKLVGVMKERGIAESDLKTIGARGKKWVGCRVWFGGLFNYVGS